MMYKIFTIILFVFIINVSCKENSNERLRANSTGRFNELIVVIPQKDWDGDVGLALKEVVSKEVLGLPQPEPQFSVIQIEPKTYEGLIKRTRNILIVKLGETNTFQIDKDVESSPQIIITITGTDTKNLINLIEKNAENLIDSYKKSDLATLRNDPAHATINYERINFFQKQKIQFNIPDNFKLVDDSDQFLWYRNETYNPGIDINGSMNVIAYTLPLDYSFEKVKDSIASIRDKVGKQNIPGPHDGMYMITEAAYTPHVFDSNISGLKAYKTLGKWEIKDAFMAGPFISYTVQDLPNNRLVVVEGFVYAPSVNKRDYMFELEAIIGTLKVNP